MEVVERLRREGRVTRTGSSRGLGSEKPGLRLIQ